MQTTQEPPTVLEQLQERTSTRYRRTVEERAAHLELIKKWMNMGVKKATILNLFCKHTGVSQATAYNDYDYAESELRSEGRDNEPYEITFGDRDAILRMTMVAIVEASEAQDWKSFASLGRVFKELHGMGGSNYGKP